MKNNYFPLFVDISDKKIVMIGGGRIATRRIKTLVDFATDLTVVAPDIHPELEKLEQEGKIVIKRRAYQREDILDAWMVLVATDCPNVNEEIISVAKGLGILVNTASNQTMCDFHFPGIAQKDHYTVGVNGGGKNHHGTAVLRKKIQELLDEIEEGE